MSPAPESRARIVALAGGKGGVGTTLLAANLAIQLARQGREVVLLDLAPGGAEAHAQLGLPFPPRGLGERLAAGRARLADLLVAGGTPNLRLLAGVAGPSGLPRSREGFEAEVLEEAARLPCDFVIVDAGSGRLPGVLGCARAAHMLLLVTTPEPAALRGVLRLHAAAIHGILERALGRERALGLASALERNGLRELLAELRRESADEAEMVIAEVRGRGCGLILNQTRTTSDHEAATRIGAALSMIQAVIPDPVLTLEYDLSVVAAVGEGKVLAQRFPNAPVCRGLEKLAFGLISPPVRPPSGRGGDPYAPVSAWNHYRVLALDPMAASRAVQRHYEWILPPFRPRGEGETIAGRDMLDAILERVESAYRALVFLESRRAYDRQLVESGVLRPSDVAGGGETEAPEPAPPDVTASSTPPAPSRPDPSPLPQETAHAAPASKKASLPEPTPASDAGPLPGETPVVTRPFTGPSLREVREKRRMELERIARQTKIRVHQIEALEDQRYDDLPVRVFLKGFLRAYARCLDLDPDAVVEDYMREYDAWAGDRR